MNSRPTTRWFLLLSGILMLDLLTGGPALAQTDRDSVRGELERTALAIERAREHLGGQKCEKGERLLDQAVGLQRKAEGEYLANERLSTVGSLKLTREARDLAVRAIQTCQVEFWAHEEIRRLLETTQELAAEAAPRIRGSGVEEAVHLLDAGLEQLQKAREAYRSEEIRRAIRLGTVARNLIQRALQKIQSGGVVEGDAELSRAALDRTQELISEVRADLGGRAGADDAVRLLESAETKQRRAHEFLLDSQWREALRWTEKARAQALEASWQLEAAPERPRIEREIEIVSEMIADLAPEIRAQGEPDALLRLEKAEETLAESRRRLNSGETGAAGRLVRIAASLLQRAAEKSGLR